MNILLRKRVGLACASGGDIFAKIKGLRGNGAKAALVLCLGLAGCVEKAQPAPSDGQALTGTERADCKMRGGTVGRGGMMPGELCILSQPDAGKACTRQTDCAGMCLAETKTCSAVTPMFGCFEFLDETGQKVGICID